MKRSGIAVGCQRPFVPLDGLPRSAKRPSRSILEGDELKRHGVARQPEIPVYFWGAVSGFVIMLHSDDNMSLFVSLFDIAMRLGSLF
jgi:hypothetical protein